MSANQQHSPEPWSIRGQCGVWAETKLIGATGDDEGAPELQTANARRIVACVNACAGISTEELEAPSVFKRDELAVERDTLRAETAKLRAALQMVCDSGVPLSDEITNAMLAALKDSA